MASPDVEGCVWAGDRRQEFRTRVGSDAAQRRLLQKTGRRTTLPSSWVHTFAGDQRSRGYARAQKRSRRVRRNAAHKLVRAKLVRAFTASRMAAGRCYIGSWTHRSSVRHDPRTRLLTTLPVCSAQMRSVGCRRPKSGNKATPRAGWQSVDASEDALKISAGVTGSAEPA